MRIFLAHLHKEVQEEFASFATSLDDYLDLSTLDECSITSPIRWWICQGANGVRFQTLLVRILSQVANSSVKHNMLGLQKVKNLVYVHYNLLLASRKGLEYNSGPCKDWDVEPESTDLDLSLAALNIEESRSGIGNTSSTLHSIVEHASCSIF